jgi:hypothetical protein
MRRITVVLVLLSLSALSLSAQTPCQVTFTAPSTVASGSTITIDPQAPSNVTLFTLLANSDFGYSETRIAASPTPSQARNFTVPLSSVDGTITFRVFATTDTGGCTATRDVLVLADPTLKALAGSIVIPAAGSLRGANGANFKTSLRLIGRGSGSIYFRRSGKFAGDATDPQLRYTFVQTTETRSVLYWNDVVAAMNASGLGSLDIRPDSGAENGVFEVEARVFNETPEGGRYGSLVPALTPGDLYPGELVIPLTRDVVTTSRVNVGFRTFSEPVTVRIFANVGGLRDLGERTFDANTFVQLPLAELVRTTLPFDADVTLSFERGKPISVYYSVTDNNTNDPTVIVPMTVGSLQDRPIDRVVVNP